MSSSTTTPQSCPENIVSYSNHSFIGKKTSTQQTLLGWDYRQFAFDVNNEQLFVVITDNTQGMSTTMGANDLATLGSKLIDDFYYNTFVPATGNTTQLSYTVAGGFLYITVTGVINNDLQITLRNDNTGVWADGSPDPESDGIEGRKPSNFTINTPIVNSECEVVEVLEDTFNEFTDKVFFAREGSTQLSIDGLVFGYSLPEATQWSSALSFNSSHNYRLSLVIDTDGIGSTDYNLASSTFTTFYDLISWFNNQAIAYGSSLRVIGDNDRIFIMQADGITPIVGDTDPYLTTGAYTQFTIEIEDLTVGNYLVKGLNPKPFNVSNVQVNGTQTGMYKGEIPLLDVITTIQPTPTPTGNTTNLNKIFKDNAGDTWIVDKMGDAIKATNTPQVYTQTVYLDAVSPATATIFDLETPAVTHDPLLMADTGNIYIGTNGSFWAWNGTSYITTPAPTTSTAFYTAGTTTDAGGSKNSSIYRTGRLGLNSTANFNPLSQLDNSGSTGLGATTVSAATYTPSVNDTIIYTIGSIAQSITLPTASAVTRRIYVISNPTGIQKTISSYTNLLGVASTIIPQFSSITLQSVGGIWRQISVDKINLVGQVIVGDIGGVSTVTTSGFITSASKVNAGGTSTITVNFASLNTTSYLVFITTKSLGTIGLDNDQLTPITYNYTNTSFQMFLEETTPNIQNVAYNIMIIVP